MILNNIRLLGAALALLGFIIFAPGCKDKTETPKNECPIAEKVTLSKSNVTISEIKENSETLNVQDPVLKGTVIESQDVKRYTYLHLKDSTGQIWAAIPKTPVETGKEIEISDIIVMKDFHSKTLDKTFDTILFAVPAGGSSVCRVPHGEMPAGMTSGMPGGMMSEMPGGMPQGSMPGMEMGAGKSKPIPQDIKVSKAVGKDAYTVEEIYSNRKELSQKPVTVRAKVVKFLPQIMEKNWIHIQDGTGNEENSNYNIVVSTLETADVGDEVLVHGTLGVDKDYGTMCAFAVIIEDASITKVMIED